MENERKILICPKCGSEIEISENQTLGHCIFCDSLTPLPFFITSRSSFDSETYKNMLNRVNKANSFSLTYQFHRAFNLYDKLIKNYYNLDIEDYYPYFGKALAQYGVCYSLNDKLENELVCLKVVQESIYENENYLRAIELSDVNTEAVLKHTALLIDQFQKDVKKELISAKPLDVCILVDDTLDNPNSKVDLALAERIQEKLNKESITSCITTDLFHSINKKFVIDIHKQILLADHLVVVSSDGEHLNNSLFRHIWMSFYSLDELQDNVLQRMSVVTDNVEAKTDLPIANVEFFLTTNLDDHLSFVIKNYQEIKKNNEQLTLTSDQYDDLNQMIKNQEYDKVRSILNQKLDQENLDCYQWWLMFLAKHKISTVEDFENKAINLQESYYFQKAYITAPRFLKKLMFEYYNKCKEALEKLSLVDEEYDKQVVIAQKNIFKKSIAVMYLSIIPVIIATIICYWTISLGNTTQTLLMLGINLLGYFFFVRNLINVLSMGKTPRNLKTPEEETRYFQQLKKALNPQQVAKFLPTKHAKKIHFASYVLLVICLMMTGSFIIKESYIKTKNKNLEYYYVFDSVVITGGNSDKIVIPSIIGGKKVTKIGRNAFEGDVKIQELIISNGVKEIGSNAFSNCKNLEKVTIPATVERIGKVPFDNSINITEFYYQGQYFKASDFLGSDYQKEMIVDFITPNQNNE